MYENKIPQCAAERAMRNRGLCIVKRDVPAFITHRPNVKTIQKVYWEKGKRFIQTVHETPKGNLSSLDEAAGFTSWAHEKWFKSPEDYEAIRFMIQDECYEPNHEAFRSAQDHFGEDAIFRAGFGLEPLQAIISGEIMEMQTFCIEWMDRQDEVLKIYDALVEQRRKVYLMVAQSPALIANYGGNVTPEIIGLKTFERYYLPHYNEAAEAMHRHGKLIGCHFDANCKLLSKAIASTQLDYVEAFTPAPDTDMTLAQARAAWPDKILWLNFPSSLHLRSNREIREETLRLLDEIPRMEGILMGITEDVPAYRWQESCLAIMDGLQEHSRIRSRLYRSDQQVAA
jgi:hypothetical protein